jgi:hypothetical protein
MVQFNLLRADQKVTLQAGLAGSLDLLESAIGNPISQPLM